MCVVSMIGDHYGEKFRVQWPQFYPNVAPSYVLPVEPAVTRAEFDELKREVAEMVSLLKRAKAYDEKNGEPGCEIEEKMALLRRFAKMVGVDLDKELAERRA